MKRKRGRPPDFIGTRSIGWNPIDSPRTSRALTDCQASSSRFLRTPGSSTWANLAVIAMPSAVTRAVSTSPIGCAWLCCHKSGIGSVNSAPPGSTMSPLRSVAGVVAKPSMMRASASTDLISRQA